MKIFYVNKLKELEDLVSNGTTSKEIEMDINNYTIMLNSAKHKEKVRTMEIDEDKGNVINDKAQEGCESGACSI